MDHLIEIQHPVLLYKTCFVFVFLFVRNIFQVNRGRDHKNCKEGESWSEPAGERYCKITSSLTSFKSTGDGCNTISCTCGGFCSQTIMGCFTITKPELQVSFVTVSNNYEQILSKLKRFYF